MTTAIIIPARYASTRLPGKPLLEETGKPLIQHVYENACKVGGVSQVIIATDDLRIADVVKGFGGEVAMTSPDHTSGSARAAEVAQTIDAEIVINLQGDEPEVNPTDIEFLIDLQKELTPFASTLACAFPSSRQSGPGAPQDPAAVKVILGEEISERRYFARHFTRYLQPYPLSRSGNLAAPERYFLHVGIYAFRRDNLLAFAEWPMGALEQSEKLEQLRILENGNRVAVGLIDEASPGIDTPEDYESFVQRKLSGR